LSFVAKLQRAREVLEQQGRLSVRALARELDVAGDELDELISELVDVQRVALREGTVLVSATAQAGTQPAPRRPTPDPRSYTPKHLADEILQSKSALEGERKQVTVGSLGHQASVCRVRAKLARALIAPGVYIARFRSRRACRLPDSRRCSVRERRERVQS
jgi:hypothetical protein